MKAHKSHLLSRMLKDPDTKAELRSLLVSSQKLATVFFNGRYYTISKEAVGKTF